MPVDVFISYSHADEELFDRLTKHLKPLEREGIIRPWNDRKIVAGSEFDAEIASELERAQIVLLLVSPDFVASEYCWGIEMTRAMERHEAGSARVIPVILRPVDWHRCPFGKLSGRPKDGKAVTLWSNQDEAFTDVAKSLREAVRRFNENVGTTKMSAESSVGGSNMQDVTGAIVVLTRVDNQKRFVEEYLDDPIREFRSVLADFRDLSALALKGAIVAPVGAVWLKTGLPLPMLTALITSIFVLLAQIWVFQAWYKMSVPKLKKRLTLVALCLGISVVGFVLLIGFFTMEPGKGQNRVIEGWILRSDIKPLITSSYTDDNALRDAQYDAKEVWTESSVVAITVLLQFTWIVAFTSFAVFISTFIIVQRRRMTLSTSRRTSGRG